MILIYYGKDLALKEQVNKILDSLHVSYVELGVDDLDSKMNDLAKKENSTSELGGDHEIFMYFYEEKVDTIEKVDNALKEAGIHIHHKAVNTPSNVEWTLKELMDHIQAEASYFKKREKLRYLVSHPDMVKLAHDPQYMKLMTVCFELLEETDVPEKMYDKALEMIEHYPEA